MARSRSYARASAAGASLPRSCSRAGGGPGHRLPATGQRSGSARRERRRLIGQDCRQASDQAERWSLVTRPVTRLRAVSAAQALYSWAFAAAQLRNPGATVARDRSRRLHRTRPLVGDRGPGRSPPRRGRTRADHADLAIVYAEAAALRRDLAARRAGAPPSPATHSGRHPSTPPPPTIARPASPVSAAWSNSCSRAPVRRLRGSSRLGPSA